MSTTTPTTEAARLCGELVTLLACARDQARNPDKFLQEFNTENLLSCASSHADELYDLLLQAQASADHAQQSSVGGTA